MSTDGLEVFINVEITVKMNPDEYDAYRAYQKEKASLERRAQANYNALSNDYKELCSAVLAALELDDALHADDKLDAERVKVKDPAEAEKAVKLAAEWYA